MHSEQSIYLKNSIKQFPEKKLIKDILEVVNSSNATYEVKERALHYANEILFKLLISDVEILDHLETDDKQRGTH